MAALHAPGIWVAIGFIVLVLAIAKKGWEAKVRLDERAERIRTSLDDACGPSIWANFVADFHK
jgi:F0F1-type ATP synthase membrane subunit b/b'